MKDNSLRDEQCSIMIISENTKCGVACNSLTQSRLRVFPVFAKDVFLEVLRELNIDTHQASFEADEVRVLRENIYFLIIKSCPGDRKHGNTGELSGGQQ